MWVVSYAAVRCPFIMPNLTSVSVAKICWVELEADICCGSKNLNIFSIFSSDNLAHQQSLVIRGVKRAALQKIIKFQVFPKPKLPREVTIGDSFTFHAAWREGPMEFDKIFLT